MTVDTDVGIVQNHPSNNLPACSELDTLRSELTHAYAAVYNPSHSAYTFLHLFTPQVVV